MIDTAPNATPYESLRTTRRALAGMSPVVRLGLFVAAVALFLQKAGPLLSDVQLTWGERMVAGITATTLLVGFGLAGWVAGRLLRAAAELIDVMVDQAESSGRAANLIEWHVAPALERMAVALERSLAAPREAAVDGKAMAVAGARQAILDERWDQADRLIAALTRDHPGSPEITGLADELAEARREVVDGLKAQLDAAQAVNDPERVIELRDALTQHLRGDPLRDLDRKLIQWLMALIQRRMRTGTVRGDVVTLATKVAESFGDTPEGASLRASLPTLRRSVGLCPRCAQPYVGLANACPQCQAADKTKAPAPAPALAPPPADLDLDLDIASEVAT